MKARLFLTIALAILVGMASGQRPAIELTFTAENNGTYVQLDSIKIMNRTQGGDTVLFYPDTVLIIDYVGIPESQDASGGFSIQAFPNPVADHTSLSLFIPEKDIVKIKVTDLMGRKLKSHEKELSKGKHTYTFTPGGENLYLVSAEWKGCSKTIKIVNLIKSPGKTCSLSYSGFLENQIQMKVMEDVQLLDFTPGDELLYIGYAGDLQSGIPDVPETSETFSFQFATNIPCPGTPTVEYEGQVYNTIQIFSQCWLKENLNVGTMIPGNQAMTNNQIIEKHCYGNEPDSCNKYGGLYQWNEMIQYNINPVEAQGICPPGWHIPSDEEWKVLEGAVDKQYGIGDPEWDYSPGPRGADAGTNLKSTTGWIQSGNGNDLVGFSGLPGGYNFWGSGSNVGEAAWWWTSTPSIPDFSRERNLNYYSPKVTRFHGSINTLSCSVRCLSDNY
jgi:uncharacterized protein (TIGR02145 family)